MLHSFTTCHETRALSLSLSLSISFSFLCLSRFSPLQDNRMCTLELSGYVLAKSDSWPLFEQTRWSDGGFSFSFLTLICSVCFYLSRCDPAEPQGRRRELLHSEVRRPGKASRCISVTCNMPSSNYQAHSITWPMTLLLPLIVLKAK